MKRAILLVLFWSLIAGSFGYYIYVMAHLIHKPYQVLTDGEGHWAYTNHRGYLINIFTDSNSAYSAMLDDKKRDDEFNKDMFKTWK